MEPGCLLVRLNDCILFECVDIFDYQEETGDYKVKIKKYFGDSNNEDELDSKNTSIIKEGELSLNVFNGRNGKYELLD